MKGDHAPDGSAARRCRTAEGGATAQCGVQTDEPRQNRTRSVELHYQCVGIGQLISQSVTRKVFAKL
jgi:hypothetical protein